MNGITQTGHIEKLTVSTDDAAEMLSISKRQFQALEKVGKIGPAPIRWGGRVLWRVDDLREFVKRGMPGRAEWQGGAR